MDKQPLTRQWLIYWHTYRASTTQLRTADIGARWFLLSLTRPEATAPVAAAWARLGYLPEEAEPQIAAGITPATVAEMEQYVAERPVAGGEETAAQRIADLIESGEFGPGRLVDPDRLIRIPDPTDPTREIITIRDEQ